MENLSLLTTEEIRAAVRDELTDFFASNQLDPRPELEEFGGVELASKITGKAVATIYDLVSKRKIPHSKQGKKLYFSKKELLAWIQSGKRKTSAEIEAEAESRLGGKQG
jgi:predicted DNA-binding transcriptional regulator AlpA